MRKFGRGEITKISKLFSVYATRFKAPQGTVTKVFCEVIYDLFNFTLKEGACTYTVATKTLHINVGGPLKSEILLRKGEILTHLKGRLGEKSTPTDIL